MSANHVDPDVVAELFLLEPDTDAEEGEFVTAAPDDPC
jgi:hypothetical protein